MCGISGFVSKELNRTNLINMTNALKHRGPDATGYFYDKEKSIGLGHCRLSILDLSKAGNQPMESHCGRYIMAYNGEVYNYNEIAKEIKDIEWKSSSDSEVVIEAFAKWGINFVHKLNGMFAIAIFDKLENKLFLFRDRIGIKPLYYYYQGKELIFGSELKSFKKLNLKLSLDLESIYSFLHLGFIPKKKSIYNEIIKIENGSFLEYNKGNLNQKYFWKSVENINSKVINDFDKAKNTLNNLLFDSVKKRLISDVPIGTFLSGGTDSSLISAIAQRISPHNINTFSIGFKESKQNESPHARKVADFLKTNHNEFILSESDALAEIENIMEHMDEPFSDSSALPTMIVSKMAKKNVKVCLSGDGGDELFMGYGAYNWARRLNNPTIKIFRNQISSVLKLIPRSKYKRAALIFNSPELNHKSHIFSQEQYLFSEQEINKLLTEKINTTINQINVDSLNGRNLKSDERQALFDLDNYLVDDLLVKVDRSSMYQSLEVRVPILDHRIIEFAINLDKKLKYNNGVEKYILKEILYDYIPKKIVDKPKWGFTIPLAKWLKNDLQFLIHDYLNSKTLSKISFINSAEVLKYKERFLAGEDFLWNRIWTLIILIKFLIKQDEL